VETIADLRGGSVAPRAIVASEETKEDCPFVLDGDPRAV
jgi:hypothetical protein